MLDSYASSNPRVGPVHVSVSLGDSGDLVATLTSGRKILVVALSLRLATSNTIKFQSGGTADLTGAMTVTALDWPWNPAGWLKTTTANHKLNIVAGSAVQISGTLVYVEVDN